MKPVYYVTLQLKIIANRERWMRREIQLPFPPYEGLHIKDGAFSCVINEVLWDREVAMFFCHTPPIDYPKMVADACLRGELEPNQNDIVNDLTSIGWTLDSEEN